MNKKILLVLMVVVLVVIGILSAKKAGVESGYEKIVISATKSGTRSTVYRETNTGQQEKILEFEESVPADNGGNYWSGLPVSVALSPDQKNIAYIDRNDLKIMDLESRQTSSMISRIEGTNRWNPDLTEVVWLARPKWSSDGDYLSFLIAYREGSGLGVVNIQNGTVNLVSRTTQQQRWSKEGHSMLLLSSSIGCDYCEDKNVVWSPETGEETTLSPQDLSRVDTEYRLD